MTEASHSPDPADQTTGGLRVEIANMVATITLDRPERRNAMSYPMLHEMIAVIDRIERDPEVRVVVVTGDGPVFCAGTDLSAGGGGLDATRSDFRPMQGTGRDLGGILSLRIYESRKVFIAAYNGPAVGIGVTMTLPMDIRIAADAAFFVLPFTQRGIVPESCSSWFLPRVVGINAAVDWATTGRRVSADEALRRGLISETLPTDHLATRAREIADSIAANASPASVALSRQLMWRMLEEDHPMAAHRLESSSLEFLGSLPDLAEGVSAFREKRPPVFTTTADDLPGWYPWWSQPAWERNTEE